MSTARGKLRTENAVVIADKAAAEIGTELFGKYNKLRSWLLLWRLGLPTLRGVIVPAWSNDIASEVRLFARGIPASALLLRSDSLNERGDYLPAGDLVNLADLDVACCRYLELGRLVFLLEPRSRFDDLYSLSVGFSTSTSAVVEIVGPGFDASDLKRGDASPHQWLSVELGQPGDDWRVTGEKTIQGGHYRQSWEARLTKVARLIENEDRSLHGLDVRAAEEWLKKHQYPLLLEHRERYPPIPRQRLKAILAQTRDLPLRLASLGEQHAAFVVSLSLLGKNAAPVYWDIVWPSAKFVIGDRKT